MWYSNVMPRDSQFHLRINKNIYAKLNKISKKEGRNISDVIREAIAEYLLTRNYLSDDPNKIISCIFFGIFLHGSLIEIL